MCPMTLAAKNMSPTRFGLWSGVILSIGNIGMLLSSIPLAFVVDHWGWRAGFWTPPVSASWWRSRCSRWCRARKPRMPTVRRRSRK